MIEEASLHCMPSSRPFRRFPILLYCSFRGAPTCSVSSSKHDAWGRISVHRALLPTWPQNLHFDTPVKDAIDSQRDARNATSESLFAHPLQRLCVPFCPLDRPTRVPRRVAM